MAALVFRTDMKILYAPKGKSSSRPDQGVAPRKACEIWAATCVHPDREEMCVEWNSWALNNQVRAESPASCIALALFHPYASHERERDSSI